MTSEESIEVIKQDIPCEHDADLIEALEMISREDARMMLTCEIKDGMTITEYIKMVDKRINELPSVTPKPDNKYRKEARRWKNKWLKSQKSKTGHWIGIDEEPHEDFECDVCGYVCSTFTANIKPSDEYKFCPNCGAEMESEEV